MKPLTEALINKKNISKASFHETSFNKKDLVLGTVVMFNDDTFGLFVTKDCYNMIKDISDVTGINDYFICYDSDSEDDAPPLAINIKDFEDDLTYNISYYDYFNVKRVYFDIVPKNKIPSFLDNFIVNILDFVKRMK